MEIFLSSERVEVPTAPARPPAQQMTSFSMEDVFTNDSPRPQRNLATVQAIAAQPSDNRLLALKNTNAGHIDHITGEWRSNDPIGPATINSSARTDNSDSVIQHGKADTSREEFPVRTNIISDIFTIEPTRNELAHEAIDRLFERIIIEARLQEYDVNESQPTKVLCALLNQSYDPDTMNEIKSSTRELKIGWEIVRAVALMMDPEEAKLRLASHWANLITIPHFDAFTQSGPEMPFVVKEQSRNSQSALRMTPGMSSSRKAPNSLQSLTEWL
jgi:hypothetical protein